MFGNTQQQQHQNTGFSFGNTTTAPATSSLTTAPSASSTGFSFGAKPASTTSTGFSFGNKQTTNTTNNTTNPSGFSFGSGSNTTSTTTPAASTGFSFGSAANTNNTNQPNNLLNLTNNNTINTNINPNPNPNNALSFNSQPSFSWSKPQTTSQSSTSLTLQQQQQQPSQQQLPTSSNTISIITTPQTTNTFSNSSKDYQPTINDKLIKIKSAWDASNTQCKMKTHLYNKVDPSFNNFTRPINETPEDWENAMKNRPKDYNSIPIKCSGFIDLFERNKLQDNHVKQTRFLLNDINNKLIKLNEKHDLHSNNLLLKCKIKQKNLNLKLLKIAINLSILKYKGYPLTNDENLLIQNFNKLLLKLDDPVGLNRINELWARLSSLKDKYSQNNLIISDDDFNNININATTTTNDKNNNNNLNNDKDDDNSIIKNLIKVLAKQQQGIQFLCELMEEDEIKLQRLANIV
jgi:nuclear pore complex protein Nup54